MQLRIKQYGFSLIEMILVLAVMSSIVLYGVYHIRSQHASSTLRLTSEEMQSWVNLLGNYYLQNERWPTDLYNDLVSNNYTDAAALCANWPSSASGSTGSSPHCAQRAEYQIACPAAGCNATKSNYMGVSLTLPEAKIAEDIAAITPGATVDGATVSVYVPMPAAASDNHVFASKKNRMGWIHSAGLTEAMHHSCGSKRKSIPLPVCPSGYEGHFMLFYQKQQTGKRQGLGTASKCATSFASDHATYRTDFGSINLTGENDYKNLPELQATQWMKESKTKYGQAYYITFCVPNGSWYPGGAYRVDTNKDEVSDAFQCGSNWALYNPGSSSDCSRKISESPDFR